MNDKLIKALKKIKEFGYENPGCGYSCAKIAEKALREIDMSQKSICNGKNKIAENNFNKIVKEFCGDINCKNFKEK